MVVKDLATRRFLFVAGKGGVGKTTVCAALALALADRGLRVLVAMCGAHERLSSIMATAPIGHPVQPLSAGVWATRIEPERAMLEYGEMVLKVKAVAKAALDNKYTNTFLRAVPGLPEWALLGKAWWHTTETRADGAPKYDIVLFDAPSTGHGLDLLRVPKVILDIVPPGVLRRDAEQAWAMFRDPEQSGVVVVTLPEELPATETIELVGALDGELGLPVHLLVVNAMYEALFQPGERSTLLSRGELLSPVAVSEQPGDAALSLSVRRASREQLQSDCLERLRSKLGLETVVLPFLVEGAGTPEGARQLAARMSGGS